MVSSKGNIKDPIVRNIKFPLSVGLVFVVIGYLILLAGSGTWSDYFILAVPFFLLSIIFLLLSFVATIRSIAIGKQQPGYKSILIKLFLTNSIVLLGLIVLFVSRTRTLYGNQYIPFLSIIIALIINLSTPNRRKTIPEGDGQITPQISFPAKRVSVIILKTLGILALVYILLSLAITKIGRYQTDKIVGNIDSNGGEIIGKSGLKITIPPNVFEERTIAKIVVSLKQHNFILERFLPKTGLKLLALLSINIKSGWKLSDMLISPVHANLTAIPEIPLNLKIPIAPGYSDTVLLGQIMNWGDGNVVQAIDVGTVRDGYAYFEPPTMQNNQTVMMYGDTFIVLSLPDNSTVFTKQFNWSGVKPEFIDSLTAKIPKRSLISVSGENGIITIPVFEEESMVYVYSRRYNNLNDYYYRPNLQTEWYRTDDMQLIKKFFKESEIELSRPR